ncbi:alpha/beta fold hydrolase [Pseudonocardia sp. HH130630-07]|uniref:alpha/beta fold hydrolase n=1 Tax=Pseudonocardia sp. HH130630-07 TaxID=1690815 RepID=UPI0008151335|nr:alpha/beta hydrolase [Pseudonocardia sp. HH130630-07]ANY07860.1 alpha/beta hydrolase [Pseudonocardia sp. HH130630-07]
MTGTRAVRQDALADLADVPAVSRWARNGAVRLHALDYGGDGVPVLVLPGITSPAVTLDLVARELTDRFRPVVLDVRGRGLSDSGDGWTLADYAADAVAVLSGLDLRDPVLLGHSMGARIAAATAVALAGRGAAPRATVLVDPPLSGPGRAPYPTTLETFLDQLHQAQRGTDADEVARSWPRWPRREQELRARWLSSCDETALRATHAGFESEDFFDVWPHVPGPVTLMYGDRSPVVPAEGAAELAAAHPGATTAAVRGAGHMVFWDEPAEAVRVLRTALAGTAPGAP